MAAPGSVATVPITNVTSATLVTNVISMADGTSVTNVTLAPNATIVTNVTSVTTVGIGGSTGAMAPPGFALGSVRAAMYGASMVQVLSVFANLVALVWFGMWMGLTSRTVNLATLKTLVFVQVIPWFVVAFASAMAIPLMFLSGALRGRPPMPGFIQWFPLITVAISMVLTLAKDFGFSLWARRRLYSEFREHVVEAVAPVQLPVPPRIASGNPPPVIPRIP
jgi:hypothetical protein